MDRLISDKVTDGTCHTITMTCDIVVLCHYLQNHVQHYFDRIKCNSV